MTRRFLAILLMLPLLWQGVAGLLPFGQELKVKETTNVFFHAQDIDHHHHVDRSLHASNALDNPVHHHVSDGVQVLGLMPQGQMLPHGLASIAPIAGALDAFCSVILEGLLRPPQTFA